MQTCNVIVSVWININFLKKQEKLKIELFQFFSFPNYEVIGKRKERSTQIFGNTTVQFSVTATKTHFYQSMFLNCEKREDYFLTFQKKDIRNRDKLENVFQNFFKRCLFLKFI